MADVTYRIVTELSSAGSLTQGFQSAQGKLDAMDKSASKLLSVVGGIGSSLADAFTSAVEKVAILSSKMAILAGGAAVAGAAFGINFNNQLEQTKIGLAATLGAFQITPNMSEGMRSATELTDKMLQDVKTMPITFQQFSAMVKDLSAPVFMGGGTANQLEEFTKKVAMFGAVRGMTPEMASQSMGQILTGRITAANPMVRALGLLGDEAHKLRGMDAPHRMEEVNKILDRYKGANDVFATSFQALFTTLKDNLILFGGKATTPLFTAIKQDLVHINEWFDTHKTLVSSWADFFGSKLVSVWHKGVEVITHWFPIVWDFAEKTGAKISSIWDKILPTVEKVAHLVEGMLNNSDKTFSGIGKTAELYGAVKLGSGVVSGLGGGAAGAAGGIIVASLTAELLSMQYAIDHSDIAARHFNSALDNLHSAYDKLSKAFGDTDPFMKIVEMYGTFVATMLDFWTRVFDVMATGIKYVSDKYIEFDKLIHPGKYNPSSGMTEESLTQESLDDIRARRSFEPHGLVPAVAATVDYLNKHPNNVPSGGGGTKIGKIEIYVQQSGDPSRVARAVMDKLADLQRYKKSSPWVPNFSSNR